MSYIIQSHGEYLKVSEGLLREHHEWTPYRDNATVLDYDQKRRALKRINKGCPCAKALEVDIIPIVEKWKLEGEVHNLSALVERLQKELNEAKAQAGG